MGKIFNYCSVKFCWVQFYSKLMKLGPRMVDPSPSLQGFAGPRSIVHLLPQRKPYPALYRYRAMSNRDLPSKMKTSFYSFAGKWPLTRIILLRNGQLWSSGAIWASKTDVISTWLLQTHSQFPLIKTGLFLKQFFANNAGKMRNFIDGSQMAAPRRAWLHSRTTNEWSTMKIKVLPWSGSILDDA